MSAIPQIQKITGTIVKVSSLQTVHIQTKVTKVHPLYRKRYSLLKRYVAHDAAGTAKVGDIVTISPCRPVSKSKRWAIVTPN